MLRATTVSLTLMSLAGSGCGHRPPAPTAADSALLAHWTLDETGGALARDGAKGGLTGKLTNGPVWTGGHLGGALALDGVDDYVEVGPRPELDLTGDFTLSAWIKIKDPSKQVAMTIVSKKNKWEGDGYSFLFYCSPAGVNFYLLGYKYNETVAEGVKLGDGWHHVAAVYDGKGKGKGQGKGMQARLYIDGVNRTTKSWMTYGIKSGTQPFRIGLTDFGWGKYRFAGAIDDVRVYGRALPETEIVGLGRQAR